MDAVIVQLAANDMHSDAVTIGAGYGFIFGLCAFWMLVSISLRSRYPWLYTPMMGHVLDALSQVYTYVPFAELNG